MPKGSSQVLGMFKITRMIRGVARSVAANRRRLFD
jgi:hypothetical protein